MQSVYNWFQDKELSEKKVVHSYKSHVATSYELLIFNVRNLILISRMSLDDKNWRTKKHLPTESDRLFRPILYENEVIASLEQNETYRKHIKDVFNSYLDVAQARKIYLEFSKCPVYIDYLALSDPSLDDHINVLLELWKYLCQQHLYIELVYDAYPCWIDDDSLVKGFLKRLIKGIALDENLLKEYKPDPETVNEFGQELLEDVIANFEEYDEQLIPYLQNWEIERIATVDRILIKMALSEFTKFPSIPTKVTLNEYVDIAKMYSTDKSKDFLNGILDALLKDLIDDDAVQKTGRGLIQ